MYPAYFPYHLIQELVLIATIKNYGENLFKWNYKAALHQVNEHAGY